MKRIISFVLCLSMLISMLPVSVFAADVEETTPVTEALLETEAASTDAPVEQTTEAVETTVEETTAAATDAPESTEATDAPEVTEAATEASTEPVQTETEETVEEDTYVEFTWIPDVELPSDEELFAGYVEKTLYGTSTYGIMAGSRLTGDTKVAYDGFRALIEQVAAGELDSAELVVSGGFAETTVSETLVTDLFYALLADLPYDLYWFDKTMGVGGSYGLSGGELYIKLDFVVSPHYSADGSKGTYDLDTAKTGAAAAAAANAQDIVDAYAESSDYEKLVAYRDEICAMTAYNSSAASSSYTGGYGDPWQLIWVFDGNSSTKVVCEGYAKAFQYLCDLSDFDADIVCYNVQGTMGTGGHMWNIVTINGSSYLVDVTNSEMGTVGYKDKLFLVGTTPNSDGSYTFANTKFAYNSETTAQWGTGEDSILTLAESNFDPDSLVAMTGEELQEALDAASGQYQLEKAVEISNDVVIPANLFLTVYSPASITVKDGGSLTISKLGTLGVANGGTLTVEQGGSLINNGSFAVGGGTVCTIDGTLENNSRIDVDYGTVNVNGTYTVGEDGFFQKDTVSTVTGIDTALIGLYSYVYDEATLLESLVPAEGYASTTVYLMCADNDWDNVGDEPFDFTQDITVPAGVQLQLAYFVQDNIFNLNEGVTLTVEGELIIMSYATLNISEGASLVNNNYTCNFGTIVNNGTIAQNGTFQQSGTLEGNAPVEPRTGAELLAELEACGGFYELTDTVVISEDMTIPEVRVELQGGAIIVEEGVTLTNNGGIVAKNGGALTVNGTLENAGWYLDVEEGGSLTINGTLTGNDMQIYGGSLTVNGTLDINQVNVGVLTLDKITLTGVPEETINYAAAPTTTDELIAALALVEQYNPWIGLNQDLTMDKNVTIPAGANVAFENSTLTVASGVTLTLDGEFTVHPNSHLVVAEGGKLVNNVQLGITNHSSHETGAVVTIDGELISNGSIWITDGGTLNVNGSAEIYNAVHAGFGGNGLMCSVNVAGTLTTYGYLNIVPYTGELYIAEGGTATVGGVLLDDEGNPCGNGYLQAGGNVQVYGTLNLDGGVTLGCEDTTSELNVYEGGVVNVPQGNMWCDITDNGLVTNEGTFNNDGIINVYNGTIVNYASFHNNGQIRLFGAGSYDDYGDEAIQGNEPCDGAAAQLQDFLNDLEDGQGANLYNTVTLAEDLTIDLGEEQVVLHGGSELHIPDGVTLTVNSPVIVNEAAIVVEEGGTLIVNTNVPVTSEGALGCVIVYGQMTINDGGTLWLDNGGTLEVYDNGVVNVLDDPATQNVTAAIHVAFFSDGATVLVEGTMNTSGYVNVTPGGWFTLREGGTLNILNNETDGCGYLDVTGMAQIYGIVNLHGLLSVSNGNETTDFVENTARVEIYGTLNGSESSTVFINPNASISITGGAETLGEVQVENMGTLWVDGFVALAGPVTNFGNIHVNFFCAESGNYAELNINDEMTNYGYLHVSDEGTLSVYGTLNIARTEVDGMGFTGYLNSFGYVYVYGTINNSGLQDVDSTGGDGFLQINEDGVLNVIDSGNLWVCDLGTMTIDGFLEIGDGSYVCISNEVSGAGTWINNGTVQLSSENGVYSTILFDGSYFQGETGELLVELYEGEPLYCDLIPVKEQILIYNGGDMDTIRTVLSNEEYRTRVTVTEDTVIDQDLVVGTESELIIQAGVTIPEDVTVTAYGPVILEELDYDEVSASLDVAGTLKLYHPSGTLTIGENSIVTVTGTVFNGTSATVHGNLIIDGLWEGYAPVSGETGIITSSGSQEKLNLLLQEETATLTFDVALTEDTVVSGYLAIAEGVTLTVPRGITLTIDGIVDVYGTLTVRSGASLVNNGVLCAYSTGKVACAGSTCYSGDGSVQAIYENETLCAITNIPRSVQTLCVVDIGSEAALQSAMDMVGNGGYLGGMLFPVADITLTEDLTVLENVTVVINGPTDAEGNYDGDYIPISLTVPEDVFVSIEGGIEVGSEATLTLDGSMSVYGYVYVAEAGCMNLNGWCDNYNALVVFGTLNQNGGLGNTGGRVRIMEGSALNLPEDAYAWNFMAYGEDGGYFGTYENYPADKLYLHTYPRTAADINTLMTEYQTGNYTDATAQIDPFSGYGDLVLDEDVTVVDGAGIMVIDTENMGGASLTVGEGVALTVENGAGVYVYNGCTLTNDGIVKVGGSLTVNDGAEMTANHYVFINDGGQLTVKTDGTLVKNSEMVVEVGGTLINKGIFTDNTTDYHLGLWVRYINGEYGTVTGIPTSQQILHFPEDMDEASMRQFITFVNEGGYRMGITHINDNLTLAEDLVIPENLTIVIASPELEGVEPGQKTFTVPEGVTVRNYGTFQVAPDSRLVVNGQWLGNVPENYGTIEGNVPMSQEELVAMIEAADPGAYIQLTRNVTLTGDLTLDNVYLDVAEGVTLYVPEGVTLTWNDTEDEYYSVLDIWGSLIVDGSYVNNAELAVEYTGTVTICEDGYSGDSAGVVTSVYWDENQYARITGIPEAQQTLLAMMVTSEEEIRSLLPMTEVYDFVTMLARHDITITEDLEIPENMVLRLYRDWAEDDTLIPASLTLMDGARLGVYGTVLVDDNATLTADGYLDISGSLLVNEGGKLIANGGFRCQVSGTVEIFGEYENTHPEDYGYGLFVTYCDGEYGTVNGLTMDQQVLHYPGEMTEEALRTFIDTVQAEGYWMGVAHINENLTLTDDLYIPENVILVINSPRDESGNVPEIKTFHVPSGITVTNDGCFQVAPESRLTVDGIWEGNAPENYGELGGDFFVVTQEEFEELLASGDTWITVQGIVELTEQTVIPAGITVELLGTMTIPEGVALIVEGGLVLLQDSVVTVNGTLDNRCYVSVRDWATLEVGTGAYLHGDGAVLENVHWGDIQGNVCHATILGISVECQYVIVNGGNEALIRELLSYATTYGAPYVEINIYDEVTLTSSLYLPETVNMTIENWEGGTANLIVPKGVTLYNEGRIGIRDNGILTVNGKYMGNLPALEHPNAQFIVNGEISFTQNDLEEMLAKSAEFGGSVCLSIPLTLTKDLVIPEGAYLNITGSITVPVGRTLTNNGWIDVQLGGKLTAVNGGVVKNNGGIGVMNNGSVNLTGGVYEHGEGAELQLHYGNEGPGTAVGAELVGVPYEYVAIFQSGWDETHLRNIINLANNLYPIRRLWINITGEMTLSDDLTIPEFATVVIQDTGYGPAILTVPYGVTLTNNGHIQIGWGGHLIVKTRGALEGNQPIVYDLGGEYVNNSFTEADLRSYIEEKAASGGEVFLSSDITLTSDLEIPENVILVISYGGALRVPEGVTLTVNGSINTQLFTGLFIQGGTVVNNGSIENMHWGVTELISGQYTGDGRLAEIHISRDPNYHYDPETGTTVGEKDAGSVVGIAPEYRTIVARGISEYNIHEVLDYAAGITTDGNNPAVEINIYSGELILTEDLTIPAYASVTIEDQVSVIVPDGVTLTNNGYIHIARGGWLEVLPGGTVANGGIIEIGQLGTMVIRAGGIITGDHPFCYHTDGTYINENTYGQAYLEALIAQAQANGTNSATLSVPVELTSDLVIPAGFDLCITGWDNLITIPEGVTLYNYGSIYCHMFGGILGQGGWLVNDGEIRALNWGVVDLSQGWGNYTSNTGARIHNHHWIWSDGTEGRGTVMGFYPGDVVVHTEGDDDRVLHEMVDFIWSVGDNENGVWSPLDSVIGGDMTLTQDLYWPFFGTMTIPAGVTLTVPAGVTLDITGTINLYGRLVIEEGAIVNSNYPICVEGGEIVDPTGNVRYYIPGTPLESFTVTTSAGDNEVSPGTAVNIWADSWTPATAEVLAFYYEVTSEDGWFTQNGIRNVYGDPGQFVSVTASHGGQVTVDVYAVIGVDENGPVLADEMHTVTVTFSGLAIDVVTKDAPDYVENAGSDYSIPGLWAGGKTIFYPTLTDTATGETLSASAIAVSYSEGYEQFAKIVNKDNVITVTALTTMTQCETIDITFTAEGAAPKTVTLSLRPKATSADVMLYGETVTAKTILADLNRGDWGFQLDASAMAEAAVPENATDWNGNSLVTWKSSSEKIATVDENGWVSFTGTTGKVKITMTTNYGAKKAAVVTFNVAQLPQEIFPSESNPTTLVGGGSGTYTATDAEGTALKSTQVKWYLSDEQGEAIEAHPYATMAATGKLTTKAVADETKVYLMAQVIGDEWSAKLYEPVCVTLYPAIENVQILDVINDPINDKTLLYDNSIHGLYYQLSWTAAPYIESVQSVSWKSSKPAVADIDESGLITLASEDASGTVKFTLTVTALNGKKSTASFTMKFGVFTQDMDLSVTLPDGTVTNDLSELYAIGGETLTFTGACVPENVTTDGIVWSVLDKTYGAISAKGVLKTKAVNNPTVFTVVAESKDGYCAYYIDVILMPKLVSTPIGTMEALLIWNDDIYLTKTTQTMLAGDGMWLYSNGDVTWKSSNANVASVSADGYLYAKANGTVTITATAADGSNRTATFTLKVSKLSQYVEITTKKGEPFTVASGKSLDLVATVTYSDDTTDKKVTWSVDDTSVATISSSGKLAAAKGLTKAATVRVYADAQDGNSYTWQDVQVVPMTSAIEIFGPFGAGGRNTDITNTTVTWDMLTGDSFNLMAAAYPADAMQDVTWKSSSTKVASIDESGNVTCLSSGTVTVTATAKDGSGKKATFKLTVKKTMEYLRLPETAIVGGGKSLTITKLAGYEVDPLATNQTLNWTMTYPDGSAVPATVATLAKGVLKTKAVTAPVTLFVRAEATDGSELAADCVVTVFPVMKGVELYNVEGAVISKKAVSAPINQGYTILPDATNVTGFGYDDDGTADESMAPDLVWTITYSKTGLVEAQFDGLAITFYATDAAKVGDSVKITLKANDGSGKSAYFTLSFAEASEPQETAELTVVAPAYGDKSADWWMNFASEFNEAYPNISLTVDVVSWMDIYTVVDTRIANGETPDILNIDIFADFQADGLLLPAQEYISPKTYAKFYPAFLEQSEVNGTVWAVPDLTAARAMYYNADILAEAGVEVPTTWEELTEVCEALKESHPDVYPWGVDMTTDEGQACFAYYTWNNGGGFVDEDGNWALNSAENVEAVSYIVDLVNAGLTNDNPTVQTRYELQDMLGTGQVAMMIAPSYNMENIGYDVNLGIAPIPSNTGESASMAIMDRMMCFDNDYTDAELAAVTAFFDFFYEDERYAQWVMMEEFLPATSSGCEALAEVDPAQAVWAEILPTARFYPADKNEWWDVKMGVIDVLQRALLGENVQNLLDELQAQVS